MASAGVISIPILRRETSVRKSGKSVRRTPSFSVVTMRSAPVFAASRRRESMSAAAVRMVVGEGPERNDFRTQLVQAPPEGLRSADPGEGAHLLSLKRGRREETARSPLHDSLRPVESPERGQYRRASSGGGGSGLSAAPVRMRRWARRRDASGFAERSPGKEPTVPEGTVPR